MMIIRTCSSEAETTTYICLTYMETRNGKRMYIRGRMVLSRQPLGMTILRPAGTWGIFIFSIKMEKICGLTKRTEDSGGQKLALRHLLLSAVHEVSFHFLIPREKYFGKDMIL